MKNKIIMLFAFSVLITGQTCDDLPPAPGPDSNPFCANNDYTIAGSVRNAASELSGATTIGAGIATILQGKPSTNRRSTVRVHFGQSYCSGIALGPRLVLSAGHCGYADTTEHDVFLGDYGEEVYHAERHLVHPDYMKWVNGGTIEDRKADLMLLYMAEDVPGPYPAGFYDKDNQIHYRLCAGAVAQGWGRHEPLCVGGDLDREICETDADCLGNGVCEGGVLDLRETKYVITRSHLSKYLISVAEELPPGEESGRICFGDSGGPLYVDVNGDVYLAGVTTTTIDRTCLRGGTHVNVDYFKDWILENSLDENGESLLAF